LPKIVGKIYVLILTCFEKSSVLLRKLIRLSSTLLEPDLDPPTCLSISFGSGSRSDSKCVPYFVPLCKLF
jgi:hypothetical protein